MISPEPHAPHDLLAFKARFADARLPSDLMPLLAFPGGYGGMVTSDGGRVTLSCCIRRDQLQRCRERSQARHAAEAVIQHIGASCRGVRHALEDASLDGAWLSAGPVRPGIRRGYADGIFRIGNAAGESHPIIAEGISMAMQSAWLLCGLLVARRAANSASRAVDAIGRDYEAEWRRRFAPRIRAASAFAWVTMQPKMLALALAGLRQFPSLLTFGAHLSGKTRYMAPAA
jgi:flavin-dependent dehydrogenase